MLNKIIWFTGLSGTGKSTLAEKLIKKLKKKNYKVKLIDGDIFRIKKKYKNSFSKQSIISNNLNIIKYLDKIKNNYDYIIVSVISPILITRKKAKKIFKKKYVEIYVNCKISTLKKRDTKGLYKKADLKIVKNLIGYNSKVKYEKSDYAVTNINTDLLTVNESVIKIFKKI